MNSRSNNRGKRNFFQNSRGVSGGRGGRVFGNNRLRQIDWGACALYFTLNGDEKRAVSEAKNLLDCYYSKLYLSNSKKELQTLSEIVSY